MKKPPNRYSSTKEHIRYGIQSWLMSKGFCIGKSIHELDNERYMFLIKSFYETKVKDFKIHKKIYLYECYVHNHFIEFTQYVLKTEIRKITL